MHGMQVWYFLFTHGAFDSRLKLRLINDESELERDE
jgi:hypothetical protein